MLKTLPRTKKARNAGIRKTTPPINVVFAAVMIDDLFSDILPRPLPSA